MQRINRYKSDIKKHNNKKVEELPGHFIADLRVVVLREASGGDYNMMVLNLSSFTNSEQWAPQGWIWTQESHLSTDANFLQIISALLYLTWLQHSLLDYVRRANSGILFRFRIGFVTGPAPLIDKIIMHAQVSTMQTSTFTQVHFSHICDCFSEVRLNSCACLFRDTFCHRETYFWI